MTNLNRIASFFVLFIAICFASGHAEGQSWSGDFNGTISQPFSSSQCASLTIAIDGTGTVNVMGNVTFHETHCVDPSNPLGFTNGKLTLTSVADPRDTISAVYAGLAQSTSTPGVYSIVNAPWGLTGGTGKYRNAWGSGDGSGTYDLSTRAIRSSMRGTVSFNQASTKKYYCGEYPPPPGYGIVARDISDSPTNPCGPVSVTHTAAYYIEPFKDGMTVCGPQSVPGGTNLHPFNYRVSSVEDTPACGGRAWVINELSKSNRVCVLTDTLGEQQVTALGYIVTGIDFQHTFIACPGPVVTIQLPKAGDVACDGSNPTVAQFAAYVLPGGFNYRPTFNAFSCPDWAGLFLEKLK